MPRPLHASALTNLVRNAVKFSHAGGAVTVRARGSAERVVIEVEDTCGGLPPGMVQQAFAPWTRRLRRARAGAGSARAVKVARGAVDLVESALRVVNVRMTYGVTSDISR